MEKKEINFELKNKVSNKYIRTLREVISILRKIIYIGLMIGCLIFIVFGLYGFYTSNYPAVGLSGMFGLIFYMKSIDYLTIKEIDQYD